MSSYIVYSEGSDYEVEADSHLDAVMVWIDDVLGGDDVIIDKDNPVVVTSVDTNETLTFAGYRETVQVNKFRVIK